MWTCGILVPRPGIEPEPPALEGGFFTTGPPGTSLLPSYDWLIFHCMDGPHCVSIHPSMDTWVVSTFWLLWIMLLSTWVCKYLFEILLWIIWGIYPEVGLLDHMTILCLTFEEPINCVSQQVHHFVLFIYLFNFWLRWVLVVACGIFVAACRIFRCGAWASLWLWHAGSRVRGLYSLWHVGSLVEACGLSVVVRGLSCPVACGILAPWTRDRTSIPRIVKQILYHWTTREGPVHHFIFPTAVHEGSNFSTSSTKLTLEF